MFNFQDKVIWDSGFGYEIGYYLGEGYFENTYLIDQITGLIIEPISHSIDECFEYSDELITKLTEKYGYEKRFSSIF